MKIRGGDGECGRTEYPIQLISEESKETPSDVVKAIGECSKEKVVLRNGKEVSVEDLREVRITIPSSGADQYIKVGDWVFITKDIGNKKSAFPVPKGFYKVTVFNLIWHPTRTTTNPYKPELYMNLKPLDGSSDLLSPVVRIFSANILNSAVTFLTLRSEASERPQSSGCSVGQVGAGNVPVSPWLESAWDFFSDILIH